MTSTELSEPQAAPGKPEHVVASLKTTLTASIVAAAVVPFLFAGILMIMSVRHTMVEDFSRRNQLIAKSLAGEIERFLNEPISLIQQIKRMMESHLLQDERDMTTYLDSVLAGYNYLNRLEILDSRGLVQYVVPAIADFKGNSMTGQPFYREAKQSAEPSWSSTFLSLDTGAPTITLALSTDNGMVVGYLDLAVLSEIVARIQIEGGGFASVLDTEGNVLAHRDHRLVNQRFNLSRDPYFQKALAGEIEAVSSTFDNKPFLVSAAVVDITRWVVSVHQPKQLALASVRELSRIIIIGLSVAIVLTLAIALVSQHNILRPISVLVAHARRIAQRDYQFAGPNAAYREVEELSRAFAQMAEAVARREAELIHTEQRYRELFEESPIALTEQDFSGAKQILDALELQEEADLGHYLRQHPDVTARCFRTIRILDANRATLELYGAADRQDIVGPLERLLPEPLSPISDEVLRQLYRHNRFEVETTNQTRQGAVLDVLIRGVCSSEYADTWNKVLVSVQDLTERNQETQKRRTLELQLQHAHKMEAIGTLAGGVAHDFNNLLMGIQGRISLLSEEANKDQACSEHLKAINDYVRSATDLTRQLLGFAHRGKYQERNTDLNLLVEKSSRLFGRTRKQVRILLTLSPHPIVVRVDRSQIEQVLLNLFVNAAQAMPEGGELRLKTDTTSIDADQAKQLHIEPGDYGRITVTDTGVGMARETLARVFEPFFTTKAMGRGTGLGLASSYGIIRNHGGTITVTSRLGQGTSFQLLLRAVAEPAETDIPEQSTDRKTGTETILLVDDEPMIQEVGSLMLKKLGYRVLNAVDGKSAIDIYTGHGSEIDLVILDLIMPDMGGKQVYETMRKINPQVCVLLSSGYSIDGEAGELLKQGCRGFIQKPFNLNELGEKVRQVIENASAASGRPQR